ncbi:hypothetical protein SPHINGO391_460131 [Sphingomonas aurantiaca]|uniref:Uncharacterized protein n=1 Tax=Sphingomonas aurantiaca TaxID=185949 RepID=A0A5E7ZLW2_9SPHN|nr:hypothetical protein SPHINGO391_460131 [Sphingomonas aurantiaca]
MHERPRCRRHTGSERLGCEHSAILTNLRCGFSPSRTVPGFDLNREAKLTANDQLLPGVHNRPIGDAEKRVLR